MKKRLISLLLCLVMAVSLFSGFAMAAEIPQNGWYNDGSGTMASDANFYRNWFYFVDGEPCVGWKFIGNEWYYFVDCEYPKGIMLLDEICGEYYLGFDGAMVTDYWRQKFYVDFEFVPGDSPVDGEVVHFSKPYDPPQWEYYGADGKRVYGWEYIDGYWYYFDGIGLMLTGWQEINGIWYYLKSWGGMDTGWLWYEDAWYYLKSWGGMAADEWEKVNGKWYLFDADGRMLTGWQGQYYLTSSGAMETGWGYIDGNWYYFGSDGAMKTGWQKVSGKWYYMDPATGVMQTGWLVDSDGKRYYLSDSGAMVTGTQTIDGVEYIFNRSGALIS